jgi:hypothetical protein
MKPPRSTFKAAERSIKTSRIRMESERKVYQDAATLRSWVEQPARTHARWTKSNPKRKPVASRDFEPAALRFRNVFDAVERVTSVGQIFKRAVSAKARRATRESVKLLSRLVIHNQKPFVAIQRSSSDEPHMLAIRAEEREPHIIKIPPLALINNDCPRFGETLAVYATCPLSELKTGALTLPYSLLSRPSKTTIHPPIFEAVKTRCLLSGLKRRVPRPIARYLALVCPSTTTVYGDLPRLNSTDTVRLPSGL